MTEDIKKIRDSAFPLGVITVTAGFLLPLSYDYFFPEAVNYGMGIVWIVTIPFCFIMGATGIFFGRLDLDDDNQKLNGLTATIVLINFLTCLFLIFILVRGVWYTGIAPSAEIVLPDDFEGVLELRLLKRVAPSAETAGKNYQYLIPDSGYLVAKEGWVNIKHRFVDRRSSPGKYFTHVRRRDGTSLLYHEFSCDWLFEGGVRCEIE